MSTERAPVPGARHAFSVVRPGSPMLGIRYRAGVVVGALGFPDWRPYARAMVELPAPAVHRTVDETRVLDLLVANEVMARSGDPLWPADQPPVTPAGWTWAHLARTRRVALVPVELHGAFRHLGGVGTLAGDHNRRGVDLAGAEPVRLVPGERLADDALVKVEERLGYPLPVAYRRFLARTNGGGPSRPAVHPDRGFLADQRLFGLARDDWLQDLVYANYWFGDRLTTDHLAVGYVHGGLTVLRVRGADVGSVWYWDDDDPRDTDDYAAADVCGRLLHRLAGDFDGFLTALRAVPYPLRRLARELAARGEARTVEPEGMGAALPATRRPGRVVER